MQVGAVGAAAGLIVWTLLGVTGVLTATIFHARRRAGRAARRRVGPPTSANIEPDD
ncbi:hypothetical protein [Micromonospora sp. NPDC049497]|uniref:hypothetical protein n=1 Tax=Micromonospora sp. NPDC049497 TaxID=3364273 RepID=UPI0037BAA82C